MIIDYLSKEQLLEKWADVLDAAGGIADDHIRLSTAKVLENTHNDRTAGSLVAEALNTTTGGNFGNGTAIDATDVRWPSIVIPTVRRIFPELIAHELFGVQPMSSSLGYAFALRAKYGEHGTLGTVDNTGIELGYNTMIGPHTGNVGDSAATSLSADTTYWGAYAGAVSGNMDSVGAETLAAEALKVGTDYPMAKIDLVKGAVEAKTRKLAANWSPELAEDLANQHGVDVDAEMTEILTYEVQAGIDRQLLTTAVKSAINGGNTSSWSPISADGRNQIERIGTILTQVIIYSNEIARNTRRGAANWAVASSKVAGLLERLNNVPIVQGTNMPTVPTAGIGSVNKVGLINNGKQLLLRDTFAGGEYILLGHKGANAQDAGIIYCPYIPMQLMRAIKDSDFSPEIGVRTRYGIFEGYTSDGASTNWGAANYYQFIAVNGLTTTALVADGSRVFTY